MAYGKREDFPTLSSTYIQGHMINLPVFLSLLPVRLWPIEKVIPNFLEERLS
jgi:hypothetical protein